MRVCAVLIAAALLVTVGATQAADPGSRGDPLATVSYVTRHASFSRQQLNAGDKLTLAPGTELIVAECEALGLGVRGLEPERDTLIDMSAGTEVLDSRLERCHHYINAAEQDLWLKFDSPAAVLLRGEWQ